MFGLEIDFLSFVIGALTIVTGIYIYLRQYSGFWQSRNIPGPKPLPILNNRLLTFLKPNPENEIEWYKKYGKIFGIHMDRPALTVGEPELVKQILVKDFHLFRNRRLNQSNNEVIKKIMFLSRDDDWKRIRTIASPTFTSGKMKKMYPLIGECVDEFIENLDNYAKERKNVDIKKLHGAYTMSVIAKCAFATKINAHKDEDDPFTQNGRAIFYFPLWRVILLTLFPRFILQLTLVRRALFKFLPLEFFTDVSRHLIKERKEKGIKRNDFLQLLIDAEIGKTNNDPNDAELTNAEQHYDNEGDNQLNENDLSNITAKKLSETEILAQCFQFFVAGFETTGAILSFCSYELALHPEIQERLFREFKDAEDENGNISYEALSKLQFLDAVISETLRMYPPLVRMEREAKEDYVLGDSGFTIPKGTVAEIPVYAIHRDPEYFDNPNEFNPDRFMPENRVNIKPYTYLPFGAGQRNCIGMRFALLEIKLVFFKVIQKFKFFRTKYTDVPLIYLKGTPVLMAKNITIGIERR